MDGEAVASDVRVPVKFELDPPDLDPDPASASAIAAMDTDTDAARTPHTVARSERVASCTQAECARRGALQ
ncbi:TonB-like protein [Xanthomonas oryzae pv. oryzae PXO99A]|uniref:TonB-like protein n=1 Tax=Xanthomonas oryzae pv. oryzae (strain PXO99A) TaxID=360094 RepID=A0A0K0GNX1_XANOP|nr:TonB-like protein [Xanthomonas oryzae pv. oryzae PXO99A]